jgi:hypothetical protein
MGRLRCASSELVGKHGFISWKPANYNLGKLALPAVLRAGHRRVTVDQPHLDFRLISLRGAKADLQAVVSLTVTRGSTGGLLLLFPREHAFQAVGE